jgi:hypothetical protein
MERVIEPKSGSSVIASLSRIGGLSSDVQAKSGDSGSPAG